MRKPKNLITVAVILALFIGGALFYRIENPPHVQLPAEPLLGEGGFFVLTNTITAAWASILVLTALFFFATRNMQMVPGRLQCFAEMVIETLLGICASVAGREKARKFFALSVTLFLFILASNWMGLLPGFGTVGIWHEVKAQEGHEVQIKAEHAPEVNQGQAAKAEKHEEKVLFAFFRSANTDLNTTIGLALISVIATQIYGFRALGFGGYASRFINLKGPIDLIVGLLETISEVAKIISLSFRLFGNIFAGEVLLGVMAFLVPWIASIPFMGLELFVGLMQAFVFMMLTLVFLTTATAEHGAEHEAEHSRAH